MAAVLIIPAVLSFPVWLIGVRVACEGAIIVFRIHDELKVAHDDSVS